MSVWLSRRALRAQCDAITSKQNATTTQRLKGRTRGRNTTNTEIGRSTNLFFDGRGRWKSEMDENEKRRFKDLAGELLIHYDYVEDMSC